MVNPIILKMFLWVMTWVLKKKIWDFSLLIVVLEALEKVSIILWREQDSWIEGFPIKNFSLRNCLWEIGGLPWINRPLSSPMDRFCFNFLPRPSTMSIKDRGSPYLIPLDGVNEAEGDPLIRMEKRGVEMREIIH